MNKRKSVNKRKVNPLARNTINRAPKMKMNFDGQILRGVTYPPVVITAVNVATVVHSIACNTNTNNVAGNFGALMNFYKEYKFLNVNFEWVPNVAPGVADGGSEIIIATSWNPEQIATYASGSASANIALLRSERTAKSYNAWERFTYSVPMHYRRKQFDVDVNPATYLTDVNLIDRTIQGAVIVGAQSISAIATLGRFRITWSNRLEGLGTNTT